MIKLLGSLATSVALDRTMKFDYNSTMLGMIVWRVRYLKEVSEEYEVNNHICSLVHISSVIRDTRSNEKNVALYSLMNTFLNKKIPKRSYLQIVSKELSMPVD